MSTVGIEVKCQALSTSGDAPLGRSSHGLVVIDNKAFVFGGEHEPRVPIGNALHRLDLQTLVWDQCELSDRSYVPGSINAATMTAVGSYIFVFGGRTGIGMGEGDSDQMCVFDTLTSKWALVETKGDKPCARSYHAMTSNNDKLLYLFGGCGKGGRLNDLHAFDTETRTWEALPKSEAIEGRGGAGLAYCDGNIYVIGGFAGREMNDVHRYNLQSRTWMQLKFEVTFPPRSVFGLAAIGHTIVTICGEVDPSDKGHEGAGQFSNECFALDTTRDVLTWNKIALTGDVPPHRGWFPAAIVRGTKQVLIFGGNSLTNERLCDTYIMSFS